VTQQRTRSLQTSARFLASTSIAEARRVLEQAIERRLFPAAAVDVGSGSGPLWRAQFGRLTFEPESAAATEATLFDLASLTKPLATTTVVMDLVARGAVRLDDRVAAIFPEWRGADREPVTIRDLLEHASGLPARLVDAPPASEREFEHEISVIPLEYAPRTQSIYSDLGFILLGLLPARLAGAPLAAHFAAVQRRLAVLEPALADGLTFEVAVDQRTRAAPTWPLEQDARRGRLLQGVVHDDYAALLRGSAGHSGLFGTAAAVAAFARLVLRAARGDPAIADPLSSDRIAQMTAKSTVPGSSRALGWDTMRPTSSCGTRMSPEAFGHVGFTGTSLWIDPVRDRYFVLLTNRACQGGTLEEMRAVRRAFHDALLED